ncbi:hypothetical protein BJD20_13145 [Acinetobacter proteolyticus]|uniref:hypothetical protein n=1 Tax=Acinetobacter proteolyticus TaxID=1776741 RepID=UPI0008632887|nr:hypothetical protein [Acinetobacter proteolyticus]OEY96045.1 hypothetical protein BJD20_13145 [Acinetobacter proteolyticus]
MSAPEQIPYVGYVANGIATEFPITFDLHDIGYLVVTLNKEIPQSSTYTVDLNAMKVVFAQAPINGDQVELYRDTVIDRDTDYKTYDNSFRPEAVNYDFDKIIHILQEQHMIDAELASRLKQEIEWRRTHDANFDELAKMRDSQIFTGLKGYVDTYIAATNPNIFGGVTAGIVFALDNKSVQTHLEIIYQQLSDNRQSVTAETDRALNAEQALRTSITNEVTRATGVEAGLQTQVNSLGGGSGKGYKTYAAMVADKANIPINSIAKVTNDPDSSKDGDYQWDGTNFTKSDYDPLTQSKAYTDALSVSLDAIRVNSNKDYPLLGLVRDGITSGNSTTYNSSFLDVRVIGDDASIKDKYFKIEYLQNGAVAGGSAGYGITISEFKKSTFATASERSQIHHYSSAQKCDYVLDGKIYTFVITPVLRTNLRFVITIDTSKMPPAGTVVDAGSSNTRPQWSYVIHPNCYVPLDLSGATAPYDSIKLNVGKNYPLKVATRNGVLSPANIPFNDSILKIRIINAVQGKYYRLAYFKNSNTSISGALDGWVIEEIDQLNYETANNSIVRVIDYTHAAPDIKRDGTIQTVKVQSATRANFQIYITLDTAKLPALETPIDAMNNGTNGRSWIIDPSCYEYDLPVNVNITGGVGVQYSVNTSNDVSVSYQSGAYLYRLTFGNNGFNGLPNIKKIERSPLQDTPSYVVISETTTDYLPPLQVRAVNNGDSGAKIYTGGNHGSSGGEGGSQTARNILYQVNVDNQSLQSGIAKTGYASKISLLVVNEIMGYNTITLNRYIVQQTFNVEINATGINVTCENKALEDIVIEQDNGLQLYTGGFQGTQLIAGGQNTGRVAFNSTLNSGRKDAWPKTFSLILQHTNGQLTMWTDRNYEAGDGRYVSIAAPLLRGGGASNTKFYSAIVAGTVSAPIDAPLSNGQSYKWRGGYSVQTALQPVNYDSTFMMKDQKCIVKTANDFSII